VADSLPNSYGNSAHLDDDRVWRVNPFSSYAMGLIPRPLGRLKEVLNSESDSLPKQHIPPFMAGFLITQIQLSAIEELHKS
jgi:hypothetical protein